VKRPFVAIVAFGVPLAAGLAFGWSYYHERTLSPEVKAAVLAALEDNATPVDQVVYLRAAKLAARTKKDADVVARLDKMVRLVLDYQENDRADWEFIRKSASFGSRTSDCIAQLSRRSTSTEREYCDSLLKADKEEAETNDKLLAARKESEKYDLSEGKRLFAELRAEMRMPPPPEFK
jgi:hypothetical protein